MLPGVGLATRAGYSGAAFAAKVAAFVILTPALRAIHRISPLNRTHFFENLALFGHYDLDRILVRYECFPDRFSVVG